MDFTEKTISTHEIYNGRIIHVKEDTVLLANGETAGRELVIHNGGVGVIAIDVDENVLLVRQYRKPYDQDVIEIPAGKLEKGENPMEAGLRELREETGYSAKKITPLGKCYPTPGYCSEVIHLFLAQELIWQGQELDQGEFVEVIKMPFSQLCKMISDNEIYDAKTIIAALKTEKIIK